MNASSSALATGAVIAIMVIALLGSRSGYRPIRGDAAVTLTRLVLGVGTITLIAAIAVFVIIFRAQ